jgi:hypothetical protein
LTVQETVHGERLLIIDLSVSNSRGTLSKRSPELSWTPDR